MNNNPFQIKPQNLSRVDDEMSQVPFGSLIGNILTACVNAQENASNVAENRTGLKPLRPCRQIAIREKNVEVNASTVERVFEIHRDNKRPPPLPAGTLEPATCKLDRLAVHMTRQPNELVLPDLRPAEGETTDDAVARTRVEPRHLGGAPRPAFHAEYPASHRP